MVSCPYGRYPQLRVFLSCRKKAEEEGGVRLEVIKIHEEERADLPSPVSNPNSEGKPPFSPPNRPTPRNSAEDSKEEKGEADIRSARRNKKKMLFSTYSRPKVVRVQWATDQRDPGSK